MKKKLIILPFILTFLSVLFAEEKGALFYEGDIGELRDSTIYVPEGSVAAFRRVIVDPHIDTCGCGYIYEIPPSNIIINNVLSNSYDTSGNLFTFGTHFPLVNISTGFNYKAKCNIIKDSILPNGDTIVVAADSTKEGNFSIVVDPGIADLPDWYPHDFNLISWERNLELFFNNTPISSMNMGMDSLELRFTEDSVEILYGYDSVSVTIANKKGNIDSETFDLTKTDSCLTKTFALAVDSTPTQNDGILQLFDSDTVKAIFRNPKLPLDTLVLSVPFYPTTAVNPDYISNQKTLSLNLINSSILFSLPVAGKAKLQIYNVNGKLVSTLVDSYKQAGKYKIIWDSKRLGSGVYYIKLSAGNNTLIQKAIILK